MKHPFRALSVLLAAVVVPLTSPAADHGDSPAAVAEPTADITDLYAWMSSDLTKLNLVMNVNGDAGPNTAFSDAVTYVFSVSSSPAYGQPQESTSVICRFPDSRNVECWAGGDYVLGDPSDNAGLLSVKGKFKVFAGLRDDPFFLNYTGFGAATTTAVGAVAAGAVTVPPSGCPELTADQGTLLRGLLQHGADGANPTNSFAGQNVLSLVVQIDLDIVNVGGPILGVSASTHASL
jgi:hypothetical protein